MLLKALPPKLLPNLKENIPNLKLSHHKSRIPESIDYYSCCFSNEDIFIRTPLRLKRSNLKHEDHLQAHQHGLQQAETEREIGISESMLKALGLNKVYNFDFDVYILKDNVVNYIIMLIFLPSDVII
ncbi:hypothetical protein EJB05_01060 [Eragrostis curvula]|uniref:Uncharacterized protein n=1 Tax=Eragrostis curvula TaxID=38414 RepID=A0A5J9WNN6_9POAL|nr:hypothetical protein EJB05_01060 [Eragrostis curvula]